MATIELAVNVTAMTDRNATVANVELVGSLGSLAEVTGSSKRENGDVYDSGIGVTLAVGRALQNLGQMLVDAGNEEVRKTYGDGKASSQTETR